MDTPAWNHGGFGCSLLHHLNSKGVCSFSCQFFWAGIPGCAGWSQLPLLIDLSRSSANAAQMRLYAAFSKPTSSCPLWKWKLHRPTFILRLHPSATPFLPPSPDVSRLGWLCSALLVVSGVLLSPSVFIWPDGVHHVLILCQPSIYRSEWRTQISTASWMSGFNSRHPHSPRSVCEVDIMGTENKDLII